MRENRSSGSEGGEAVPSRPLSSLPRKDKTWMAATSAAMTTEGFNMTGTRCRKKRTRVGSNQLHPILLAGIFLAVSTSLVFSQPATTQTCNGCPNVTPFACYPPTHISWTRDSCGCLVQRCSPDVAPTAGNPTISETAATDYDRRWPPCEGVKESD